VSPLVSIATRLRVHPLIEYPLVGPKIGGLHVGHSSNRVTLRLPGENGSLTAASEAFALDFVSSADRTHYTALLEGTSMKAALAGSLVHTAEVAALALLETMAGSRVVVAGSKVAAGSVR
jgi:hypothetical protein